MGVTSKAHPVFSTVFFGGPYSLSFFWLPLWHKRRVKRFLSLLRMSLPHSLRSPETEMHHTWKKSTCFSSPSPLRHRHRWSAWVAHIVFYYYRCCCGFTQVPATATTGQKGREEKRAYIFAGCVWDCEWKRAEFAKWLFFYSRGLLPILITSFSSGPPVSSNIFAFLKILKDPRTKPWQIFKTYRPPEANWGKFNRIGLPYTIYQDELWVKPKHLVLSPINASSD